VRFGLYAPIPMATVGSPEVVQAIAESANPSPAGRRDAQYDLGNDLLRAADRAGYDLCLFAERHLGQDLSAWLLAAAIGARFERMCSLVAVHPGLWDPVMTAKLAVSIDRMCGGRMALNIVNGWFDEEFRMFGGTVLEGEPRYRRAEEFIAIMRGLWANETFTFHGDHYNVVEGRLLLKPASPTAPEIYSVSAGDRGRDFIADHCDWWFVNYPKDAQNADEVMRGLEVAIGDMKRRAARAGREIRYAINPFMALGDTAEEALDTTVKRIFETEPNADPRKIEMRMLPMTKAGLMGRPADIIAQLERFEDIGIELILCKMIPTVANIERIARDVHDPYRARRGARSAPMAAA
jgi:FMNH2-dependent dimethyl sulfone monooxygenase